jgi:hypothetical protein
MGALVIDPNKEHATKIHLSVLKTGREPRYFCLFLKTGNQTVARGGSVYAYPTIWSRRSKTIWFGAIIMIPGRVFPREFCDAILQKKIPRYIYMSDLHCHVCIYIRI